MMAQTAEDVANEVGLPAEELSKPCDNQNISLLADCFSEWRVIFASLLSNVDLSDVTRENESEKERRRAALRKWKGSNGSGATYKVLVSALLDNGEKDQAEVLCRILAKQLRQRQAEHTDAHNETPMVDDIILESGINPQLSRRHISVIANEGDILSPPSDRHQVRHRRYFLKARSIRCNRKCIFLLHLLSYVSAALTVLAVEQRSALLDIIQDRHSYLVRDFYSPGDSRLLPLSVWDSMFHRSINFELTGDKFTASASIYVVDSSLKIPLKYNNTAPVEEKHIIAEDTYRFWKFYLYANSVINGTVCTSEQPLETFIVKGHHNMDNWHRTYHDAYVINKHHLQVTNCQSVTNINYTIVKEDYYFVVVFNRYNKNEPLVNINLDFKRFQYSYTRLPNCTLTPYKECSVSIPFPYSFTQEFSILILTSIPREVDWDEEMFIKMSYRYRIMPCIFVSITCYILTGLLCCWCYRKYCK